MPATYDSIATTTLSTTATSMSFNSIPGTYTDFILVWTPLHQFGDRNMYLQINNDTGLNYSTTYLAGSGSAASSGRQTGTSSILLSPGPLGSPITNPGLYVLHFMNYSNTTTNKTVLGRYNQQGSTYNGTVLQVGMWRNTSAITKIELFAGGTNAFLAGSKATLYGIKAA